MSNLKRVTRSSAALWRQMPTPVRVATTIVAVVVVLYVWQILLGLFILAAVAVGSVQIIRWLVQK